MRKVLLALLAAYFILAAALIAFTPSSPTVVTVLTVEGESSFFLTSLEDRIAFTLYLDDPASFLTDPHQIVAARLESRETTLALAVVAITPTDRSVVRDGVDFTEFRYEFTVDGVALADERLLFDDAALALTFEDGMTDAYLVGDVIVRWGSPGDPRHLDFMRLSAVFDAVDGPEAIAGILISLHNGSGRPLEVVAIDLGCPGIASSLGDAIVVDPATLPDLDLPPTPTALIAAPVPGTIPIEDETLLYVPIVHDGRRRAVTRFMVVITYRVDDVEETFAIDDFAFRSPFLFPAAYGGAVHAVEHRR